MNTSVSELKVIRNVLTDNSLLSEQYNEIVGFLDDKIKIRNFDFNDNSEIVDFSSQTIPSNLNIIDYQNDYSEFEINRFLRRENKVNNNNFSLYSSQKWFGNVNEISGSSFFAKLEDLTNGGTNEYAEFDIIDISNEDIPLLKIGACFYCSVGYSSENGQVSKKSLLRFQRISSFTNEETNDALERGRHLSENIKWE